ncbi:MAG: hypothetical protein IKD69_06755 [Solobacterium sp.]|nr:hypothetical protein [Solobacterium sp.]
MKPELLDKAIGNLDDSLLETHNMKPRLPFTKTAGILAGLCAALLITFLILPKKQKSEIIAYEMIPAVMPETKEYRISDELINNTGIVDQQMAFYQKAADFILADEGKENKVFSPLNLYLTLAELCELTAGTTQKQLLDLLNLKDMEELRRIHEELWRAAYCENESLTLQLSGSLWLDNGLSCHPEILRKMAETYHFTSAIEDMGSQKADEDIQNWLNNATHNLLKDTVDQIHLEDDTAMALYSTIYYASSWMKQFRPELTSDAVFHAPDGDMSTPMMHCDDTAVYYKGEHFTAVIKDLSCTNMLMILPEEGYTPEDILNEEEVQQLMHPVNLADKGDLSFVHLSLPRFSVSGEVNVKDMLKENGITDLFEAGKADFTPLTDDPRGIFVTEIKHAAKVNADEEGVVGAACTAVIAAYGAFSAEEKEVVFDRPFLFALTSPRSILFEGIVNIPEQGTTPVSQLP